MKVINEMSLQDFEFWCGAKDTADQLTTREFQLVESQLEELYPDGMTENQINDLFRFDENFVFQLCGKRFGYTITFYDDREIDIQCEPEDRNIVQRLTQEYPHTIKSIEECPGFDEEEAIKFDDLDIEDAAYCQGNYWNKYTIPTYAIYYLEYGTDESGELSEEDLQNINRFLEEIREIARKEGMTPTWVYNQEEINSPFFSRDPEFGLPAECVTAYLHLI